MSQTVIDMVRDAQRANWDIVTIPKHYIAQLIAEFDQEAVCRENAEARTAALVQRVSELLDDLLTVIDAVSPVIQGFATIDEWTDASRALDTARSKYRPV